MKISEIILKEYVQELLNVRLGFINSITGKVICDDLTHAGIIAQHYKEMGLQGKIFDTIPNSEEEQYNWAIANDGYGTPVQRAAYDKHWVRVHITGSSLRNVEFNLSGYIQDLANALSTRTINEIARDLFAQQRGITFILDLIKPVKGIEIRAMEVNVNSVAEINNLKREIKRLYNVNLVETLDS